MNTVKITHPCKPLMIAHRGVSGLETENTHAAFVAAGNRSYFGIETDVHRTLDGKFVVIHDDDTARVAVDRLEVEQSTYDTLRSLLLKQRDGKKGRTDIRIPSLQEYLEICRDYEKTAVLELKNEFSREDVREICRIARETGYMQGIIFISFCYQNLLYIREDYPHQPLQFLCNDWEPSLVQKLTGSRMDLDIRYTAVEPEMARMCREAGIKINCWTVNTPEDARKMMECGVDFITTNILE